LDGTAGIAAPPTTNQTPSTNQTPDASPANVGWNQASVNTPVSVGSRVYARENSKVGIAFSGRNYARLNPNTGLDVLTLNQRRTQLALREGSCVFSVGALAKDELFEVGTPNGAVDFTEPGLYQVGIDDGGSVLVSCLSGGARVVRDSGQCEVTKGQLLTLAALAASDAVVSELSPNVAGTICNDYYQYRYPRTYDGRYADYNRYLNDPYYYDPYRRSASYQYIPDDSEVAGLDDLDEYGEWTDVPEYGHCWHPRVSSGWAPYRDGYWSDDYPLGLTWVANEHWGWAPYHYGRWAFVNQSWMWVPKEVVAQPVYSPALVAFVQMPEPDRVGWLPLGPGDPYVPRYYGADYRPQYIGSETVVNKYVNITNVANYNVPGAVTVVDTTQFTRVITPSTVERVDPAVLARTRPVVDPFAVPSVRELAPNMMAVKPAAPIPITAEQALVRPVVVSQNPVIPSVAANTLQALKAQPVPEEAKKNKLKLKEGGQPVAAVRPDGLPVSPASPQPMGGQNAQQPTSAQNAQQQQQQQFQMATQQRQARIAQLAPQAAQGDKSAKREMRQLEDQQRVEDKAARKAAAQGTAQPGTPQQGTPQQGTAPRGTTQQGAAQPVGPAPPGQKSEQRKAAEQAAQQQAQQAEQERHARAAQLDAQQKAQKQAARQQAAQQAQQATTQQEEQRQQEKAARKAQQQQSQQQPQQAGQQQQQQEKAARRAAQQQAAQQQAQQAEQQRQQQKAQRRAERQNTSQQQPSPQQPNPSKEERKQKNKNSGQQ
jgi:DNA segregation ATPase FtsK/SpoIIIE-like protein